MTCGAATGANQVLRDPPHGLTYDVQETAAPAVPLLVGRLAEDLGQVATKPYEDSDEAHDQKNDN
jgi:hypothetical protein